MSLPLIILAVFSIFFGYITRDIFIGLGSGFFADNSIFIHPTHEIMLNTEFAVPTLFKLLPLVFTVSLSILAIVLSEFLPLTIINFKLTRLGYNIFGFFNQRFLIEMFYNKYITGLVLMLGGQTSKVVDKGSVELLGPFGLEKGLVALSRNISSLDLGIIISYTLYILIGLILYVLIPYLNLFDNSLLLLILLALFSIINVNINEEKGNKVNIKKSLENNIFGFINSQLFNVFIHINIISATILSYIENVRTSIKKTSNKTVGNILNLIIDLLLILIICFPVFIIINTTSLILNTLNIIEFIPKDFLDNYIVFIGEDNLGDHNKGNAGGNNPSGGNPNGNDSHYVNSHTNNKVGDSGKSNEFKWGRIYEGDVMRPQTKQEWDMRIQAVKDKDPICGFVVENGISRPMTKPEYESLPGKIQGIPHHYPTGWGTTRQKLDPAHWGDSVDGRHVFYLYDGIPQNRVKNFYDGGRFWS